MSSCLLIALGLIGALYYTGTQNFSTGCECCFSGSDTGCSDNSDCGECGDTSTTSCVVKKSCSSLLGCSRIESIKWTNVCAMSECEKEEALRLSESGFETWRTCPVQVAAQFLSSPCIPCEFRGKPAYLKDVVEYCSKHYVLLGVSCVGDIAFELDSVFCGSTKIYTVCRFAAFC